MDVEEYDPSCPEMTTTTNRQEINPEQINYLFQSLFGPVNNHDSYQENQGNQENQDYQEEKYDLDQNSYQQEKHYLNQNSYQQEEKEDFQQEEKEQFIKIIE
jgi:hypothetical protein